MDWDAYGPDDPIDDQGADYLYEQLAGILAARIRRGDWKPRRLIPSETHLSQEYKLARKTIRRAIGLLVERGIVEVKPQRGVFVKPSDDQDKPTG